MARRASANTREAARTVIWWRHAADGSAFIDKWRFLATDGLLNHQTESPVGFEIKRVIECQKLAELLAKSPG